MLDHLSLITTPIELFEDDKPITRGTGFYYIADWGKNKYICIITNYHVITGNEVHEKSKKPKGNRLIFYIHIDEKRPSAVAGITIPLFTPDGEALWLEHSNNKVDIGLIPLPYSLPFTPASKGIDDSWTKLDMRLSPSEKVTLVGYPLMYFDKKNSLPLYKTGSIASEFEFDHNGDPCFLIDISAFKGNSGSPVFAISNGSYTSGSGGMVINGAQNRKFLGVYSANTKATTIIEGVGPFQQDLQLGVVWKAKLIPEIIAKNSVENYEKIVQKVIKSGEFRYKISNGFEGII